VDNNQYLVPANSKRGQLIMGIFQPIDLIIFVSGIGITFILLLVFTGMDVATWVSVIAILPAGIASALIFPIPNYHNVRVMIGEVINFYSNNRNYVWRGWCIKYESRDKQ